MLRSPAARIGCVLVAVVLLRSAHVARAQESSSAETFRFGPFETEVTGLNYPIAATITKAGDIWVMDRIRGRFHVHSRDGAKKSGTQFSQLIDELPVYQAEAFAFSPNEERLVLVDTGFDRLIVFGLNGEKQIIESNVIGNRGSNRGEFCQPAGVAWLDEATIVVADRGNDRVQIVGLDGAVKRLITGPENEPLVRPGAVAVDVASRLIAVAEPERNRVRVFNTDGNQTASWGDWGPFPGLFDEPIDVQWHGGRLYVVDRRNHRVQSFKPDGSDPQPWGQHELVPHEGNGKLHYPDALAIAPDGSFAVVVEAIEDRVQVFKYFDPENDEEAFQVPFDKTTLTHLGEFADTDGNLLVAIEPENHFVFVFDLEQRVPIILNKFGERGEQFGLIVRPTGIDLDFENRSIMLVDPVTRRISEYKFEYDPAESIRYHPDMTTFARSIDLDFLERNLLGDQLRWPIDPGAIDRDAKGLVYLADKRNRCVLRFAADFSACDVIPGETDPEMHILEPTDIAVTDDGETIVVADGVRGAIQMFNAGGKRRDWPQVSLGPFLDRPSHLAIGGDDRLYITCAATDEIVSLDFKSGANATRWGTRGSKLGELWKPADLVVDSQGRIVVIDHGNHRAQIYSTGGEWLVTFGAGRAYTRESERRRRGEDE